jgi:hypothetical protein
MSRSLRPAIDRTASGSSLATSCQCDDEEVLPPHDATAPAEKTSQAHNCHAT